MPNFDKLARPYRWLEYLTFGPYLHRTRTHYLAQLLHCRSALVLGDGDGRFTAALLRANPQIQIHAIDISHTMLQSLRKQAQPHGDRLTTEQADLRHWQPNPAASPGSNYDLITTHFLLDCLSTEEVSQLAHRLAPSITPQTQWLISEFNIPKTRFGHLIAKPLIALLYQSFRLLTGLRIHHLPNHPQSLTQTGWQLQNHHPHLKGLLISQLWHRQNNQCAQAGTPPMPDQTAH